VAAQWIMTRRKQGQRTLWEGIVDEDVRALWEPWMMEADSVLEDEELIQQVFEAQGKRHEYSATKGRSQTPAEIVLRLLLLKHVRNWSFDVLEREVRMNLAYRDFARIGLGKVPDAKTLARIAQALGGEVIAELHRRLVEIAQQKGVIRGRKMRVDTTVVETNIHYPTDSSMLGDGARVLTRTMKKIERKTGGKLKRKVRNRTRSINKRVIAIATASRHKGPEGEAKRKKQYRELLRYSRQVLNDAKRVIAEVEQMPAKKQKDLRSLREHLSVMAGRVRQVVKQTQIVTHYDVFDKRPSDRELFAEAVATHKQILGRAPNLATADAGYYSQVQERAAQEQGVKWVAIPNRSTRSVERKVKEKTRWFKKAQRWRTGCEGRISVLKRRHGLNRCRYRGEDGMKRWVGLGVLADTLINMGNALAARA
jgi:IS5 family transposase